MAAKRLLILAGDFVEDYEVMAPQARRLNSSATRYMSFALGNRQASRFARPYTTTRGTRPIRKSLVIISF